MKMVDEYRRLHERGKYFPGYSLGAYVAAVTALVAQHQPARLLDFGSGRGFQYLVRRYHERWGGLLPHCYDIGVPQLATKPEGRFSGVICTDLLEHIEERDVPGILDELFAYTDPDGFMILGISCRPTRKKLSDGRDVHVCIRPPSWWVERLVEAAARKAHCVHVVAHFDVMGHFDEPETPWDAVM